MNQNLFDLEKLARDRNYTIRLLHNYERPSCAKTIYTHIKVPGSNFCCATFCAEGRPDINKSIAATAIKNREVYS